MSTPPGLKKPKMEREEESNGEADNENGEEKLMWEEREEALVALIEHRTKEVEHLRQRLSYYKSQLHNPSDLSAVVEWLRFAHEWSPMQRDTWNLFQLLLFWYHGQMRIRCVNREHNGNNILSFYR
ncbi:unnamed protein product [Ilex paraguariensis]|uniref:Uncharacterized protein n=1 Tax=Ilex paraguariensis TaxID=185542 RepID=A0ABC8UDZ1_9AQUA